MDPQNKTISCTVLRLNINILFDPFSNKDPIIEEVVEKGKNGTEEAIALIEVDGRIDQSVLAKVRELPQVVRADYLQFSS